MPSSSWVCTPWPSSCTPRWKCRPRSGSSSLKGDEPMTAAANRQPGSESRGICVIMAGGRGTRFWPLSRTSRPKQLQALATGSSLPMGRNTAPCAVLGLGVAARLDATAPVALLPADHFIPDEDRFRAQLAEAFSLAARQETVVTLGIRPTRPETGYGYIQTGEAAAGGSVFPGEAFVEKPNRTVAEGYVRSDRHFWNSGMFVWNPDHFAAMAARHLPGVCRLMRAPIASFGTPDFPGALTAAYADCPAESVDVAVMEKLPGFSVLEADFRWSDLGSWDAWGELADTLEGANHGVGDLLAVASEGNIIRGGSRLVALLGVNDLIVVDTPDALLVADKSQAQRIKDIIARLESEGRADLL
ncbi:hypothetical protein CSA17_05680 [bacterium DOLJORAL78_65_58]|nr:MAG: hypothetical protein CSA17_05680 [bacterium DOLJORAL78_65_58]